MTERLFVYGTLKRGGSAHDRLRSARFLGDARTIAAYRLIDRGAYPGLIEAQPGYSIPGEVYEIPDDLWPALDAYEDVAGGLYERVRIRLDDGSDVWAYRYRLVEDPHR